VPKKIVLLLLFVSTLAFAGISFIPLLSGIFQSPAPQVSSSPSPSSSGPSVSEIERQRLQSLETGYERILEQEPENQVALKSLLETRIQLMSLGFSPVQALIEPLERLIQFNPDNLAYQLDLAQVQRQAGQLAAAAESYRKILSIDPTNTTALQGYVPLLLEENQPATAISLLENALKTASQPNQPQSDDGDATAINLLLSQVYLSEKNYSKALELTEQQIKSAPQDYRPVRAKAIILGRQGNRKAAADLFKQAIDLAPAAAKPQLQQEQAALGTSGQPAPQPDSSQRPLPPSPSPSPAASGNE
jgi:Tfp pilus assembly protein PilF